MSPDEDLEETERHEGGPKMKCFCLSGDELRFFRLHKFMFNQRVTIEAFVFGFFCFLEKFPSPYSVGV